jgi:hypothetical protein
MSLGKAGVRPLSSAIPVELENRRKRASEARASSAMNLARTGVGEGPEECAGVLVHDLTKVHGDGEHDDQEEEVDAKE